MSKYVVIVQNDPDVPPGTIIGLLEDEHIPYCQVRPYLEEPFPRDDRTAAVIVLGGSMGVADMETYPFLVSVLGYISHCLEKDIPLLGVCLGGQLLASQLGAVVTSRSRGEKGICRIALTPAGRVDPLFNNIPDDFVTFEWHDDSFTIPPRAIHVASSPHCFGQVFRFRSAWGLQFHPEVTEAIVTSWCITSPESRVHTADITSEFRNSEAEFSAVSRTILKNFFSFAQLMP